MAGSALGCWYITEAERDREGVGGADGAKELARDTETRRGSGGTSTHPNRAVKIAVSEGSGASVELDMNTSESSSTGSLDWASAEDKIVARKQLS